MENFIFCTVSYMTKIAAKSITTAFKSEKKIQVPNTYVKEIIL